MRSPRRIDVQQKQGNQLFPVFLKLNQLHTLLVGAGSVGLEKLSAILRNSPEASVTVVSIAVSDEVRELARHYGKVSIVQRQFIPSDLNGADLVIVATADSALNRSVLRLAKARGLLVNVADQPDMCDFYLGSIVQKGHLKIGISTNGKSPTMARRLKQVLNEALPEELDEALHNMNKIRDLLKGDLAFKVQKLNQITQLMIDIEKGQISDKDQGQNWFKKP